MNAKKIVIIKDVVFPEEALSIMRNVAQITVPSDNSEEALLAEIKDADTLVVASRTEANRRLIESAPRLKHIARLGVGVDKIDLQAATERGIFVTNMPEVTADSVSEFTMALLLGLAKNIPRCDKAIRDGRWDERFKLIHENIELNGKVHGIIGMGRIGRRVAIRCQSFSMRVIYYKRNRDLEFEKSTGVEYLPFQKILEQSDSISLHLPLTKETENLFDKPQFLSMKRNALLINLARANVVNNSALIEALKEGLIGGYATDTYEIEPPDPAGELFKFKNVVFSPHLAASTIESQKRFPRTAAEAVVAVVRGDIPENVVNREVLEKIHSFKEEK